jgi:hypothetical protein
MRSPAGPTDRDGSVGLPERIADICEFDVLEAYSDSLRVS